MTSRFKTIGHGQAVAMGSIPQLPFEDFAAQAAAIVAGGGHVVQFFAFPHGAGVRLMAVLRDDGLLAAVCDAPEAYPALTPRCPAFHLFEREIAEQYGIRPEGHPWLKMVRYHPNRRGVADVFGNDYTADIPGRYPYYAVTGDEIHEVAVGPVHAGVIEPGALPEPVVRVLGGRHSVRINTMVVDVIEHYGTWGEVGFSPVVGDVADELERFMFANVYLGQATVAERDKAARLLHLLFEFYLANPAELAGPFGRPAAGGLALTQLAPGDLARAAADYVAGMTDRFAIEQFEQYFVPSPVSIQ